MPTTCHFEGDANHKQVCYFHKPSVVSEQVATVDFLVDH